MNKVDPEKLGLFNLKQESPQGDTKTDSFLVAS